MIHKSAFVCHYCGTYFVAEFEFLPGDDEIMKEYFCPTCSDEMSSVLECCGSPVPILSSSNIKTFDFCPSCGESIKIGDADHKATLVRLKDKRDKSIEKRRRKELALRDFERTWEQEQRTKR